MAKNIDIAGRLHSRATGNVVAGADEILDDSRQKKQSVINAEVDASIEELREGLADAGKVDDVEVNGVSVLDPATKKVSLTIPTSASAEAMDNEPGTPTATAEMVGTDIHFTFRNIKGEKGDPLTWNDLTDPQKASLKGDPGDCAVYDPESPDAPDFVMAQGLGNSTTKSMTQKAVTEAVMETVVSYTEAEIESMAKAYAINNSDQWRITNSSTFFGHLIPLMDTNGNPLYKGCKALIAPSTTSTEAKIAFVKEKYISEGSTDVQYANGCSRVTITEDYSADIPLDAKYLYVSNSESATLYNRPNSVAIVRPLVNKVSKAIADFSGELATMGEQFLDLDQRLSDATEIGTVIASEYGGIVKAAWNINSNDCWESAGSRTFCASVNISQFRGKRLRITLREGLTTDIALCTTGGSSATGSGDQGDGTTGVVFSQTPPYTEIIASLTSPTTIEVPNDISYLWARTSRSSYDDLYGKFPRVELVESIADSLDAMGMTAYHVDAVNGNDDNDGLASNPLRTFSKAFEKSGIDVCIVLHGDTSETFAPPTTKRSVTLIGAGLGKARIIKGFKIEGEDASFDSETGIYSYNCSDLQAESGQAFGYGRNLEKYWLFQHGIADADTAITNDTAHPCQRGKDYRCDSTFIKPKTTLANLQSDESPAYFYDSANTTLYFRIVEGSTLSGNPLVLPLYHDHAINISGRPKVKIVGVEALYADVLLSSCVDAELSDCAAKYAYSDGGFRWDETRAAKFIRCEAAGIICGGDNTGGGDGFNAHMSDNYIKGVTRLTATLIDCWAHDCNDDGYSDHNRAETTIIGGLYEYCGKGGLTPSFGASDTIIGAECRFNSGAGILYTGETPSANVARAGLVVAKNCICYDNGGSNYRVVNTNGTTNFKNVMMLYQCISKRAGRYGYEADNANCIIRLTDCTDLESASGAKSNVTSIENTTVVS